MGFYDTSQINATWIKPSLKSLSVSDMSLRLTLNEGKFLSHLITLVNVSPVTCHGLVFRRECTDGSHAGEAFLCDDSCICQSVLECFPQLFHVHAYNGTQKLKCGPIQCFENLISLGWFQNDISDFIQNLKLISEIFQLWESKFWQSDQNHPERNA